MPNRNPTPHVGQIVYGAPDKKYPSIVVSSSDEEPSILIVPYGTDLRRTHKGNVYNADGQTEWRE